MTGPPLACAQVLREFLADFEEKMELGENPKGAMDAAQLSYPTALNPSDSKGFAKKTCDGTPAAVACDSLQLIGSSGSSHPHSMR